LKKRNKPKPQTPFLPSAQISTCGPLLSFQPRPPRQPTSAPSPYLSLAGGPRLSAPPPSSHRRPLFLPAPPLASLAAPPPLPPLSHKWCSSHPPPPQPTEGNNGRRRDTRTPPPCRPSLFPSLPYIKATPSPAPPAPLPLPFPRAQHRPREGRRSSAARRRSPLPALFPPLRAPGEPPHIPLFLLEFFPLNLVAERPTLAHRRRARRRLLPSAAARRLSAAGQPLASHAGRPI
jgi:hypothetical protein